MLDFGFHQFYLYQLQLDKGGNKMNSVMFLIGTIIFVLYISGLMYAIYWGHNSQRIERENDPEMKDYYGRHGHFGENATEFFKETKHQNYDEEEL